MAQKDPYTPPADNQGINSSKGGENTGSGTDIEGLHSMPLEGGKGKMDYGSMKGEGNTSSSNDDGVSQPTSHKYKCDKGNAFTPGA